MLREQSSSVESLDLSGRLGDLRDDSAEILFQSFFAASSSSLEHPLFDVVRPAFPLPTAASLTFQDALKDGSGEAVVALRGN